MFYDDSRLDVLLILGGLVEESSQWKTHLGGKLILVAGSCFLLESIPKKGTLFSILLTNFGFLVINILQIQGGSSQ